MSAAARCEKAVRAQTWAATLSAASRVALARSLHPEYRKNRGYLTRRAIELQRDAAREYDYARRLMGIV